MPSEGIRITAFTKFAAAAHMAEEKLSKHAITCDEEKYPSGNSLPMMSMEAGQDLESLPPHPKIKLIKLREFSVISHANCRRKLLISEEKNRLQY